MSQVRAAMTRKMVRNIMSTFNQATPGIIEQGANWYSEAENLVTFMASEFRYTPEHCATMIAHLSPQLMWSRNIIAAWDMLHGHPKTSGVMNRSWDMAKASLKSDKPLETLNGNKVKNFAANILGDTEAVTVDVWAVRVALGAEAETFNLNLKGNYDHVVHAYRLAASKLGVTPRTCQAVCWVVARGGRAG